MPGEVRTWSSLSESIGWNEPRPVLVNRVMAKIGPVDDVASCRRDVADAIIQVARYEYVPPGVRNKKLEAAPRALARALDHLRRLPEPIDVLDDQIVDGRNRYRVLVALVETGATLGTGWGAARRHLADADDLVPGAETPWFRIYSPRRTAILSPTSSRVAGYFVACLSEERDDLSQWRIRVGRGWLRHSLRHSLPCGLFEIWGRFPDPGYVRS